MDPRRFFGSAEREAIAAAAAAAESQSRGEIVPYVVGRCDEHPEAVWSGAALGALTSVGLAVLAWHDGRIWGAPVELWIGLPALVGAALGGLLALRLPALGRRLIGSASLERRVRLRAEAAFLEEEVFDTRERSGILVMLALYERRALILADSGINAQVAPEEWQTIVDALTFGLRRGRAAEAMVEAIEACGELLETRRVERRADDVDEIPNVLRVRDR
ncbi:MAG: hypothetical protein KDH92_06910 [Chloroflexi bacterium]|nr:hypothetical protein [Chloroflexota bacterium]